MLFHSFINFNFAEPISVPFSPFDQLTSYTFNWLTNSPPLASPYLKEAALQLNSISRTPIELPSLAQFRVLAQFIFCSSRFLNWSSSISYPITWSSLLSYITFNHGEAPGKEESVSCIGLEQWREKEGGRELSPACGCTWHAWAKTQKRGGAEIQHI
jgi:hypothetical protein